MRLTAMTTLLAAALLAGCGTSAEKSGKYLVDPPKTQKRLPDRLGRVEVREVSLPQYASGQEIAFLGADGAVHSGPDALWADDQQRVVTQVLAREISALSGATAIGEPWPLAESPDKRLEVRVEQMVARSNGTFHLSGQYFVSPVAGSGADVARRFDLSIPIEGTGPAAIAAAQARAIQALADKISRLTS